MKKLALHCSRVKTHQSVEAMHYYCGDSYIAKFKVKTPELFVNEDFKVNDYDNVGLWNYDVVEIFLHRENNHGHYLELQASPLQQFFALLVKEPRKTTEKPKKISVKIESEIVSGGFNVSFTIPLEDIPGEGSTITGNLFACLGNPDERSYFAINPNLESVPDFHRPDLFLELGRK
jgi:hypothetical protein